MTETTSDQDKLLNEAIDLVIRVQNDPNNPVTIELVRAWRSRSAAHEGIWTRVYKVHGSAGKVLNHKRTIERRESLGLTRRNLMIGGLMALGGGTLTYAFGPGLLLKARADHITAKGEIRNIALSDGSTVTLGPDSAIELDFQTDRRNINLLAGMGYFVVAPDKSRPFSVSSTPLRATALGTAFDVSIDAGVVSLSVDHGVVETTVSGSDGVPSQHLEQGQWIVFDPASQSIDRGTKDASQVAIWRDNLIIAEREAVSTLVARIGRWIPGSVVVADPFIGSQRVSGIFDLSNPVRALEAVVQPAGGHVHQISSLMTVISPI